MTRPTTLLLSHTFATVFMTGLIWFVQIVHYPLLASVGCESYAGYQQQHEQRTGWLVAPVMLLELATGILLVFYGPERDRSSWLIVNLALLAVIWLSTFFFAGSAAPAPRVRFPSRRSPLFAGLELDPHRGVVRAFLVAFLFARQPYAERTLAANSSNRICHELRSPPPGAYRGLPAFPGVRYFFAVSGR